MRDSITLPVFVPDGYKLCGSGDQCLHPDGPIVPITEFYANRSTADKLDGVCRYCRIERLRIVRRRTPAINRATRRSTPQVASEGDVIQEMRQQGIYANPGKISEWGRLDVIAWGCVRIDSKSSGVTSQGAFSFGLGKKDDKYWMLTDLIVLVCRWDSGNTYHVFPSNHIVFFRDDGSRKRGVGYTPNTTIRKPKHSVVSLTDELMDAHRDKWELVEEYRQRVIKLIASTPRESNLLVSRTMNLNDTD